MNNKHHFHLVTNSTAPITVSIGLLNIAIGLNLSNHIYTSGYKILVSSIIAMILVIYSWSKDVSREASYEGCHNRDVSRGILISLVLFIASEVCLFLAIFWTFGHSALNNIPDTGGYWPPFELDTINVYELPILNTILLLSAGFAVTWAHHGYTINEDISKKENTSYKSSNLGFLIGIAFAIIFSVCQGIEYVTCGFDISDSVFANSFYMATTLHGLHVIMGAVFLLIAYIRLQSKLSNREDHNNLISALWYFHFTDVVWMVLFIIYYYWGFDNEIEWFPWYFDPNAPIKPEVLY